MPIGNSLIGDKYKLWPQFWIARRQNPGGTSPLVDGKLLGFSGTLDITGALNSDNEGEIKLKIGNSAVSVLTVDFTGKAPQALSPANAAAALNAALGSGAGAAFGVDAQTGRLSLSASNPKDYIQIYSKLAGALHFGNCRLNQGYGSYFYNGFTDDLKSATPTVNYNDDVNIENDNGWGDKVVFTRPGSRGNVTLSIVDRRISIEMKQMLEGGVWRQGDAETPESYNPPASSDEIERRLDVHVFTNLFSNRKNTPGSHTHTQEDIYIGCVGHALETGSAGNWSDGQYDLTAASYSDASGVEMNNPKSLFYTQGQWDALDIRHVICENWEQA